ncbi:MAG TPA: zinc-binding dehydrogenase [Ramlibacter sp.]|jgi:NADPH2:quinone reductase
MKSYWMKADAGSAALEVRDVPVPQPGAGQLVLRMHAAGLNRGEFLSAPPGAWKAIGGEGAGEVTAVGRGVTGFAVGDRVMGRCPAAFSEYAVMDAGEAMRVPEALTWEMAGAMPMTYIVSYDMLVLQGRLAAGEWVLVNGVASGVGVASLQIAKVLGAKVIGTSRSRQKLEQLPGLDLALGASRDFSAAVMEATGGRGADLVINAVGGTVFEEGLRSLAYEGRMAIVGYVDGVTRGDLDLLALHGKRNVVFGVSNKLRTREQRAATVARFAADLLPHFAAGRLQPKIDQVAPFDELPAAKARLEADGHVGKLVLRIA